MISSLKTGVFVVTTFLAFGILEYYLHAYFIHPEVAFDYTLPGAVITVESDYEKHKIQEKDKTKTNEEYRLNTSELELSNTIVQKNPHNINSKLDNMELTYAGPATDVCALCHLYYFK